MGAPLLSDYLWPDVAQGRQPQGVVRTQDWVNDAYVPLGNGWVNLGGNPAGTLLSADTSVAYAPGLGGAAAVYAGAGYSKLGAAAALCGGQTLTWGCVISGDQAPVGGDTLIFGKEDYFDDGFGIRNPSAGVFYADLATPNGRQYTPSITVAAGPVTILVASYDGSNLYFSVNGSAPVTVAQTGNVNLATQQLLFGALPNVPRYFVGNVYLGFTAKRFTSPAQLRALSTNPWQLFATPVSISFAAAASGGGATATPSGVSAASAIGTPIAIGSATASPAGVSATSAIGTPVATDAVIVTPTGVQAASSIGTPTASGSATASPAGVQAASAIGTPTGAGAANAFPSGVQATSSIGTPVATGSGASATASPAGVQATSSIGIPVAGGGATAYLAGILATSAVGIPRPVAQPQVFGEPMISTSAPRNWTAASQARNWTSRSAPRNWTTSKD